MNDNSELYGGAWFTLAIVNAGLAQTKNRSRWRWFVISLFIGPLATALIVVWPHGVTPAPVDFHPAERASDRWLTLSCVGIVLFVFALLVGITAWHDQPTAGFSFGLAGLSLIAVVVGSLGYLRHRR